MIELVSTHSRLKAAGFTAKRAAATGGSFNTQPPKGGWGPVKAASSGFCCFNTQPPKGGWVFAVHRFDDFLVSTHSRLKAAGYSRRGLYLQPIRFNTQPPKGGWFVLCFDVVIISCFNTQPPKGGWAAVHPLPVNSISFNTQPPKGGW